MNDHLCIILARGGSKRVPRKNIRPLAGKPLVQWPVTAAVQSGLFRHVLISTEDEEIAAAAVAAGAEYPFPRPRHVADDFSTTADVVRVTLEQWKNHGAPLPEYCCCLYGTSVFATPGHLNAARKLLSPVEFVMAVTEYAHPIQRALAIAESGALTYVTPEFSATRTQDCPKTYHDIGLLYYFSVPAFLRHGATSFVPLEKRALVLPRTCAMDIDTEEDLLLAELMARHNGFPR